jgi:hypothetical protein
MTWTANAAFRAFAYSSSPVPGNTYSYSQLAKIQYFALVILVLSAAETKPLTTEMSHSDGGHFAIAIPSAKSYGRVAAESLSGVPTSTAGIDNQAVTLIDYGRLATRGIGVSRGGRMAVRAFHPSVG